MTTMDDNRRNEMSETTRRNMPFDSYTITTLVDGVVNYPDDGITDIEDAVMDAFTYAVQALNVEGEVTLWYGDEVVGSYNTTRN